jgi:cutinase
MNVIKLLGSAVVASWAMLLSTPLPSVSAQPCPDVEVVFARGTGEPAGVGGVGQAFVDAVRSQADGRSVGVYAVNYPASADFGNGIQFAQTIVDGLFDARDHVESMAATCPNTRMVLGGYSQGAAVIDLATTAMPPQVADHIAAAAIFGGPRSTFADTLSPGPLPATGPLYVAKTIDLCVPNDPICFQGGWDMRAHGAYVQSGMVNEAAAFAASRL